MLDVNAGVRGNLRDHLSPFTRQANDALIRRSKAALQQAGIARHMTEAHVQQIRARVYAAD
jgi:hypothetical protein